MDPASLANLDPKLKETYERVMGTTAPPDPVPTQSTTDGAAASDATPTDQKSDSAQSPGPVTPATNTDAPASTPNAPSSTDGLSTPVAASLVQNPVSESDQPQTVTINQPLPNPTPSNIITQPHGHMGLIRIFYILGATVFFVIYVFFWMKIFNFSLPF